MKIDLIIHLCFVREELHFFFFQFSKSNKEQVPT